MDGMTEAIMAMTETAMMAIATQAALFIAALLKRCFSTENERISPAYLQHTPLSRGFKHQGD
jgi:hypothetical protein